ncbi:general amino acid permease AGP2 [Desarmillaria tabescens]|uniref:General amino acid permease AGP2 n=1 Tax=Armillaria tabescens TaxID=1929756 RepID=A0AA39ND97_ARMTA|nr:general amino acid permease AGP2 [Desarmillaria tabescens]KAK0463518.1 general amino acid permease AGP2 [Desarmillaria tabescens]
MDDKSVNSVIPPVQDSTQRTLKSRHIQLIGIGGTALFVQIGSVLPYGGPGSLLLAFALWATVVLAINSCLTELVTWVPVSSPFSQYADRYVDPALGICVGLNFFLQMAMSVPFEITAFNLMLRYWTDKIPTVAVIIFILIAYTLLNIFAVKYYGEAEYWLAIGKVILTLGLFMFTFVTMAGANPIHDRYGFRNWDPLIVPQGTPFATYVHSGSLGHFLGFLRCLTQAVFTVAGPELVAMTSGEAENPRKVLPRSFNAVFYRLGSFFIVGAFTVGTILPYTDPKLALVSSGKRTGAAASPYIIAMENLDVRGWNHLEIAMFIVPVGPSMVLRSMAMSLNLFVAVLRRGSHFIASVSERSSVVLEWFTDIITVCQSVNYAGFYMALKIQGISRNSLPYRSKYQPYLAFYSLFCSFIMIFATGFTVFLPGQWNTTTFVFSYILVIALPILFGVYKLTRHTKWRPLATITFFDEERKIIDDYERSFISQKGAGLGDFALRLGARN